jgi:hypothetical protein
MGKKDLEINAFDYYGDKCLGDSISNKKENIDRRPKGLVKIYELDKSGNRKLVHKGNLVVYLGRELLAQRLVNTENAFATPTKDEFLTWFGLGDGGVDVSDPFVPIAPVIIDDDLSSRVMINATDSSCADYHVTGTGYPETGYYKKPFNSVTFEPDELNGNSWLIVRISVTIGANDSNGNQLSEAGLFTATSGAGGHSGQFSMFSKVTFPTIVKTDARRLVFVWYLYL